MQSWAPGLDNAEAKDIAIVGVDALVGGLATRILFRTPATGQTDERYIAEWTTLLALRIGQVG